MFNGKGVGAALCGRPKKFFINFQRIKYFPLRAKLAKRAQWAKQQAGFGAAVKIFKAYAAEYFGHRKSTVARRKP